MSLAALGRRPATGTRRGVSRPQAARKRSGPPLPLRLLAFGLLIFLAARLATMAWESVQEQRARLFQEQEAESPFPMLPVLKGGQDGWADASLAGALVKAVAPSAGSISFYVKSLNTGASADMDADRVVPSASLFKVPILVEVLRQQSLGLFDMDTQVLLQQRHWAEGSGVLQAQIGKKFSVRELLNYMIGVSDNVAALALLDLVGTDSVNLTLQANGLEATRLRIGNPARDWGGQPGENTTTAREMGILLEKIATGKILDEKASEEAVRLLSQPQQASWLPALLPKGVQVAHKSGELPGVRHDAGVVYTPRGQFVVVVLNSGLSDYDAAAQSIARVARAAYDYFETGRGR